VYAKVVAFTIERWKNVWKQQTKQNGNKWEFIGNEHEWYPKEHSGEAWFRGTGKEAGWNVWRDLMIWDN